MPPPYVKTIREEILYEYAKLISRSACSLTENKMLPRFYQALTLITHTNTWIKIANAGGKLENWPVFALKAFCHILAKRQKWDVSPISIYW
jgi:hypothetical protein